MTAFASESWVDAWWTSLRSDDRVRDAAVAWVHGPWLLVIEADAKAGLTETIAIRMDIHAGEIRDLRLSSVDAMARTPWTFAGAYPRWKALLGGTGSLLDSITDGRVRSTGDLPELHRHDVLVSSVLANAAALNTAWPEAPAPVAAGAR